MPSQHFTDSIIRMAWEDRTSFEEIRARTGLCEKEVIATMRQHLKASSFRLWRKRMRGRITKHGRRFRENRQNLKNPSQHAILSSLDA